MTVLVSPPPVDNPLAGHEPIDQAAWDDLGKTGIVYDTIGTSFQVTATGSNTSVSVGTVGNIAEIRGYRCRISAGEVVALGTSMPTTGQSRWVLIVLRLKRSDMTASIVPVYGSSVTGTPVEPSPTRDATFWDLPLAAVRQFGPAGITTQANISDRREWTAEHQYVADGAALYGAIGATRTRAGVVWERRLSGVTPTWAKISSHASGVATFTTDSQGLGYINHGLPGTPTSVTLTPAYTNDVVSATLMATVGALEPTRFQVVCLKNDQTGPARRLATTLVQLHWTATL